MGPGSVLPGRGVPARVDITGCSGYAVVLCGGPHGPGLRVLSPQREVCDEAGGKQSMSAGEETLDEGWSGVRGAVTADGPL